MVSPISFVIFYCSGSLLVKMSMSSSIQRLSTTYIYLCISQCTDERQSSLQCIVHSNQIASVKLVIPITRCSKGEIRLCSLCLSLFLLKSVSENRLCL